VGPASPRSNPNTHTVPPSGDIAASTVKSVDAATAVGLTVNPTVSTTWTAAPPKVEGT
jgi:hypothetical protein